MAGSGNWTTKLKEENEQLKKELAEMRVFLNSLKDNTSNIQIQSDIKIEEKKEEEPIQEEYRDIPINKPIQVMSLFSGGLNLKTSADTANPFRFTFVGQTLPIIYADLVKIMAYQRKFFEQGYCMPLDKDVIRANYLEDCVKKFLDAKTINSILDFDIEKVKQLFSNTTKVIQQTVVDVIINKINSGDSVDKNKVSVIGTIYGHDIFELASKIK